MGAVVNGFINSGLARIATARMREQAAEILYLDAAGHTAREIAKLVGVKVPEVEVIRTVTGDCLIESMRDEGYADIEIIRTLGVATGRVLDAVAA